MPTLSTATPEELQEALLQVQCKTDLCANCGKRYTPKTLWQRFCSAKCRNHTHNSSAAGQIESLTVRLTAAERQNKELEKEVELLQERVTSLLADRPL